MNVSYKRKLSPSDIGKVLSAAGVDGSHVEFVDELTEGTFNTAYLIRLRDGTGLVLKVSPRPDTPIMSYERGLMHGEVTYYTATATVPSVPVPRVVHADFDRAIIDGDALLMSECPGQSWHSLREQLGDHDRVRLRTELGRMVAALHGITGTGFGYPRDDQWSLADSWRESFTHMFDLACDDAKRYQAELPVPADELSRLARAHSHALDEIDTPVLVHFDLWNGNILINDATGRLEIGGLIDGERAFWGDPVAEFVSLALFSDIEADAALLAGYRDGGGQIVFDAATRLRLSLYRCYLYLIMLAESVPRGYSKTEREGLSKLVGPHLIAAVKSLPEDAR